MYLANSTRYVILTAFSASVIMRNPVSPLMTPPGKVRVPRSLVLKAVPVLAILTVSSCDPSLQATGFHCRIRLGFLRALTAARTRADVS